MGILKAVAGAVTGGLADSWLEVVEPDNMTATTVCTRGVQVSNKRSSNKKGTENIISNGSVIHVGVNQMMLLVDGGKIIDYSAEPGYYEVYLSSTPSMFNGELKDSIKETFSRIKFGGQPSGSQQVYFINCRRSRASSSAPGMHCSTLTISTTQSCLYGATAATPSRSPIR